MNARSILTARRHRLLVAATSALLLGACGSGEDDPATQASSSAAGGAREQTLQVSETDFAIEPRSGQVDEAGVIRISVGNDGQEPHSLAVETPTGIVRTDTLAAGQNGELLVTLPEGTFTWFCPVGDHRERGMEGELLVGGGDAGPGATESRGKAGTY